MGIFEEAVGLRPDKRAKLVDVLLSSLDRPDEEIDRLWSTEAERRVGAHERGLVKALSLEEVLERYR
ncbi:MAG: addiction module protein [Polyangia bacterium]